MGLYYNGQGNEGDEGHEGHEGHESHEEEDREQDRQGQICKGIGLPCFQGQDRGWYDCGLLDQEQARKGREQEKVSFGKKSAWIAAVTKARKALGLKGFVAIKKGSALYKKAKELYQ